MAGVAGFEPTDARVKVSCLTTWLYPNKIKYNGVNSGTRTHDFQSHNLALYQLNYIHHMVHQKGFEPLTPALEGRCSIQLSYWCTKLFNNLNNGAGDGNRTHATSLEGWGSTIELHPHICCFSQNAL